MEFLAVQNGFTVRDAFHRFHKGPQEQRDTQKMVQNGKANCSTLLKRITRLNLGDSLISKREAGGRMAHMASKKRFGRGNQVAP